MTSNPFHSAMNCDRSAQGSGITAVPSGMSAVSYGTPVVSGEYEGRISWFFKGTRDLNFVFASQYLEKAMKESKEDTFCLIFNTRDVLKGKGERDLGRKAMQWLLINYPEDTARVVSLIPEYGRWDDLYSLFPRVLDLVDLAWVNSNFCSHVTQKTLEKARIAQKHVVVIFKDQLQCDWRNHLDSKPITLAAKWCETEGSGDDKRYGLVQQICAEWKLHPKGYRVRVGEMRTALNVVEKLCAGKRWDEIDYSKVPAQTMKKLHKAFDKNDHVRFGEWLRKLHKKDPTVKVCAKTLHPHELVASYFSQNVYAEVGCGSIHQIDRVIEDQWSTLEDIVKKSTALEKTIVVSDVSGSMYFNSTADAANTVKPAHVCIALSLMIARCSRAPWNNAILPFSVDPHYHKITSESLHDRISEIQKIPQGFNTDFIKVFQNILERHDRYKLKPEDHPERIIVISDMPFDQADRNITNLAAIDQLYAARPERGSQKLKRPALVFWNVSGSLDFPVTEKHKNLCLISGFSTSVISALMTATDFSPACVLREVIDSDRYNPVRNALKIDETTA